MTNEFTISGTAALLAIAACADVTFALPFGRHDTMVDRHHRVSHHDAADVNATVTVERVYGALGGIRYHCTVHAGMREAS